jgi:hypothetical protein
MADDHMRKALLRQGFALEYVTLAWNVAGDHLDGGDRGGDVRAGGREGANREGAG